jgi:predicted transcriptional regulator
MKVKDIMKESPPCCTREMNLEKVSQIMQEQGCSEIFVIESDTKRPIGRISDQDIASYAHAEGKRPIELHVKDCMMQSYLAARIDMDFEECLNLFENHDIRKIAVVDEDGICCGFVDHADVALKNQRIEKEVSEAA